MKKELKYVWMLIVFFALYSCTEKDLDVASTQEVKSEYYKSDEQVAMAVSAAYDPMGWTWRALRWGGSLKTYGNFASDDAVTGGGGPGDQQTYQDADRYKVLASDPGANLESFWTAYFMGISRANLILDNVKPESPVKKAGIAQAKFLKGFYYFYLARMFGGLPLMDKVQKPEDLIARSSQDETFSYIENLLNDAIASGDLQERTSTSDPVNGLGTKASAQALLGKVYLYHKKFNEAIPVLKAVADNPYYALEPGFWKIHKGTNLHGIESIFEINFSSTIGSGNEGNSDIYLFGPRLGVTCNDTITSGWGFNQPTQELVDAFLVQNDNIRLNATVFYVDTLKSYYARNGGDSSKIDMQFSLTGYYDRKHYSDPNLSVGNTHSRFSNPDKILRLGDVFVMLAEAYVRTGNSVDALTYINKVKDRAHIPALTAVTLTDVKQERRLELALEGERYFDLVRWTGDPDLIDADHVLGPLGYANGTPGTKTKGLFPIPQFEINSTYGPNELVQNEGY